ncbi:MAG: matrixin family metalloprotease [Dehalococcoidia bacterium]|nr:matrixin family metalloprotease [Dehalococcoidia bacterium]
MGIRSKLGLAAVAASALWPSLLAAPAARAEAPASYRTAGMMLQVERNGTPYTVVIEMLIESEVSEEAVATTLRGIAARFPLTSEPTVNAAHDAFTLDASRWPDSRVAWAYNPTGRPAALGGERDAVATAANSWNAAGAFSFVDAGATGAGTGGCHGATDGVNTLGWANQDGSVLAITCGWYSGARSTEFDMEIDPDWDWTIGSGRVGVDLQSVVLHEFGHALGLAHSDDRNAVMYSTYLTGTLRRELAHDDVAALTSMYGAAPTAGAAAAPSTFALQAGANLLTWPSAHVAPAQAFSQHPEVVAVYALDAAGRWRQYLPGAPAYVNDLAVLEPGMPYWVLASASVTVAIQR